MAKQGQLHFTACRRHGYPSSSASKKEIWAVRRFRMASRPCSPECTRGLPQKQPDVPFAFFPDLRLVPEFAASVLSLCHLLMAYATLRGSGQAVDGRYKDHKRK